MSNGVTKDTADAWLEIYKALKVYADTEFDDVPNDTAEIQRTLANMVHQSLWEAIDFLRENPEEI